MVDRTASVRSDRVLVAYATKHGSTREVADVIATTLQKQGLRVDLRAADTCPTLEGYGAVVLGGALYMGHWHKDARHFLERHRKALATMPLAIFAMGPKDLEPASIADARRQLDPALKHLPEPGPIAVEIFGGVIDPSQLHFPFDHLPATDARDWDAIRAWAGGLARQFPPVATRARRAQPSEA